MVGNCHPLLASAKDAAGRTRKNMTPRTSHKGEKQNHALEKCIAAANRGWMSEKYLPPAGQEKCFFLTSPFIEPAIILDGKQISSPKRRQPNTQSPNQIGSIRASILATIPRARILPVEHSAP
jgi:hypothetical protein